MLCPVSQVKCRLNSTNIPWPRRIWHNPSQCGAVNSERTAAAERKWGETRNKNRTRLAGGKGARHRHGSALYLSVRPSPLCDPSTRFSCAPWFRCFPSEQLWRRAIRFPPERRRRWRSHNDDALSRAGWRSEVWEQPFSKPSLITCPGRDVVEAVGYRWSPTKRDASLLIVVILTHVQGAGSSAPQLQRSGYWGK